MIVLKSTSITNQIWRGSNEINFENHTFSIITSNNIKLFPDLLLHRNMALNIVSGLIIIGAVALSTEKRLK